ncbi:hypothetical protein UAY_00283 [Enterococcus moraviensis ATCC BAA-383]|uniref:Uncharacterized protein n=1 Tax=Enterococcus moraviensis ATCC BAA-383 TaxID=1158609 RepID=R2RH16_9ENTE|nr:hypothetical protein [Enterococcus moraviensis]EOI06941.1 hypothetical protein UAY_00283 [Enterococcus moraviensis ATCC BAA-383]EOT65283.1 hypothetical protein I586_03017 [Enterococcus moraviensis ATCC BAA-383]
MEEKLNLLSKDEKFVSKMNKAFVMTNSDTDISEFDKKSNTDDLSQLYVDINGHLESLVAKSSRSSGVVSGLRGTGKTHLMLLAREKVNNDNDSFCFYLNLKGIVFPENSNQEITNKVFSIKMYEAISNQLIDYFNKKEHKIWEILEKNKVKKKIIETVNFIGKCKFEASIGNFTINDSEKISIEKEETLEYINTSLSKLSSELGLENGFIINLEQNEKEVSRNLDKVITNGDLKKFLDISSFKNNMIRLMEILGKKTFTFYLDDWEKLKNKNIFLQEQLSRYIDTIIGNPVYVWIGIVPGRGDLHGLTHGSDLQHRIDLDSDLIFEKSKSEGTKCIKYFTELVNKRLHFLLENQSIDISTLLTSPNLLLLVHASMGNSRDFLNMLSNSWDSYISSNKASKGRTFARISKEMIIEAIESIGAQKKENIVSKPEVMDVWNDIKEFCLEKEYSHFAIENTFENNQITRKEWFEELIYQRIIHFRKANISKKDTSASDLNIYAINYSMIYDRVSGRGKKLDFVVDSDTVHNKIRRYIYNPKLIFSKIETEQGKIINCLKCDSIVSKERSEFMWNQKKCPNCGADLPI